MKEWIVVDNFGNTIAQGFFAKDAADMYARNIPNATVIPKN